MISSARLAEIIQHQRGQRHREPGEPDRQPAEMAHVGIHRLAAGHGKKRRAENGEADVEVLMDQEVERIERTERGEHAGRLDDAVDAEHGEHQEPGHHDRSEYPADEPRALPLHR